MPQYHQKVGLRTFANSVAGALVIGRHWVGSSHLRSTILWVVLFVSSASLAEAQDGDQTILKELPKDDVGNVIQPGKHQEGLPAGPDALDEGEIPDGPPEPAATPTSKETLTLESLLKSSAPTVKAQEIPVPPTAQRTPSPKPNTPTAKPATPTPQHTANTQASGSGSGANAQTPPSVQTTNRKALDQADHDSKRGTRGDKPAPLATKGAGLSSQALEQLNLYWSITIFGLLSLVVLLIAGYQVVLRPQLRRLLHTLQGLQGLSWEDLDTGVERLNLTSASRLLGRDPEIRLPLPTHGVTLAVVPKSQLLNISQRLSQWALKRSQGDICMVSPQDKAAGIQAILGKENGEVLAQRAPRLIWVNARERSLKSITRIAHNMLRPGQSILVLEHPSWLHELDAPSRSSWVLARIEERLVTLAKSSGIAIWVILKQGPLSPRVDKAADQSAHLAGVVTLSLDDEMGLKRLGILEGKAVNDQWQI